MIENSKKIQSMLNNIIEKTETIKNDFNRNGKTHYSYILEKLESAQWDLNVLIKMARDFKENK